MKSTWKPVFTLALAYSLTACGPSPNPTPTPKPTTSPTPSATPTPAPTVSPTPTPSKTPDPNENAKTYFFANLTGGQEVPAVNSSGMGSATLVLAPGKSEAQIEVRVSGLSGPITGAHVHRAAAGAVGAVVKELEVKGNVVSGTWRRNDSNQPFSSELLNDLENGNLYINVHTAANPGGEIRGQLTLTNDQLHVVYMSAGQEVPPVTAGATGYSLVRVRPDGSQVTIEGHGHNLSGEVTGAHVHRAAAGANGPVVKPLQIENNSRFSVTWRKTDAENPLTDELLDALKKGELYLNVHTVGNLNGEMRGQIGTVGALTTTVWFAGELQGAQEVPPANSAAFGAVEVKVNAEAREVELEGYISGLSGPITMAHVHQGASGTNGQIVKNLTFSGNKVSVSWKTNDANQPLTNGLWADLLLGNLYVNVHTDAFPGGEARAQLRSTPNKVYAIGLEGSLEVPSVNTSARASAWVQLSPDHRTVTVTGTAHGLSGPITGAHIHQAPLGLAGPVVKDLVVNGTSFSVTWKHTDAAQPLTPELVAKLMNGELYVNVHTNANPNGEVRGQIQ